MKNQLIKVNRCEVFRKANTKDKHMLGNIKNTSQILTNTTKTTPHNTSNPVQLAQSTTMNV